MRVTKDETYISIYVNRGLIMGVLTSENGVSWVGVVTTGLSL